ncbi:MAG TPA: efflux RND transporter periplasmic adaptor subunit [Methylomirabilota bacterium]|nr:efflux RND transporter periplasmic adaptor subunit [Methylomirabilota bacterium]
MTSKFNKWMKSLVAAAAFACVAATAQDSDPDAAKWAYGITEPINDVTLSAPLAGVIGARLAKEGEIVKQGSPVVELDKRLEELEVERRKLVLDQRKTDLDSTMSLFEKKAISISREEMDKRKADFNIAQVEFELAKEQLRKRQIIAPFEGAVTDLFLEVGESCQSQQALVRLVDTRRCYFIANVEAKAGHGLKVNQQVQLEIDSGATTVPVKGSVYFVSPVVDPASGLMKVKVIFENADGKIRPGVAGRLKLD